MTTITYQVGDHHGQIVWAAAEEFAELRGKVFDLGKMEAKTIITITDLSPIAKLLLSAVAGAIIQHLMDQGAAAADIFTQGVFWVE